MRVTWLIIVQSLQNVIALVVILLHLVLLHLIILQKLGSFLFVSRLVLNVLLLQLLLLISTPELWSRLRSIHLGLLLNGRGHFTLSKILRLSNLLVVLTTDRRIQTRLLKQLLLTIYSLGILLIASSRLASGLWTHLYHTFDILFGYRSLSSKRHLLLR